MSLKGEPKGRLRQLIRCHQILERLASRRIDYNANLLAEELGYTTKTIYRDLRALKQAGVFIEYEPRRKRYLLSQNHLAKAHLGEPGEATWVQDAGLEDISLSLTEASHYLGLSPRHLKGLAATGRIPAIRRGRRLRVAIRDLLLLKDLVSNEPAISRKDSGMKGDRTCRAFEVGGLEDAHPRTFAKEGGT
jgi:excisionase family DNA binding protein